MNKLIFFVSASILLLNSCSSGKTKQDEILETKSIEYPKELESILENFKQEKFDLEFNLKFFEDSTKNNTLNVLKIDEVKFLNSQVSKDNSTETNSYYLNDYYSIEQVKMDKKYEEYLSKLDIGMMKEANCYALSKLEFGDSLALLIWKIDFSSYEACPYYTGTHILGTIVADGKVIQTMQIASQESAADAPMASSSTQFVKISKTGKIAAKYENIVDEEESIVEHTKESKDFQITKKGFKLISSKK